MNPDLSGIRHRMRMPAPFEVDQLKNLIANGKNEPAHRNHFPVVYLEIKKLRYKFLLTEVDPFYPTHAFGLCDYDAEIKIGYVNITDLQRKAELVMDNLSVNREFVPKYTLAVYAKAADDFGMLYLEDKEGVFDKMLARYSKGRNNDARQDLQLLKHRLSWM